MNPVAFNIFGLEVRWYGIIIATSILLGLYIADIRCKRYDISFEKLLDVFLITLPFAIIGARSYYVIFNWKFYSKNLSEIINIRGGGLAIHGAIIAVIIVGYMFSCKFKIDYKKALDVIAPSLILGQAFGRWGNFFNQEAHGSVVSYDFIAKFPKFIQEGMKIDGQYYHPTFLYESLWNFIIFGILIYLSKKNLKSGVLFLNYLIMYSVGRVFIEGLRTDSLMIGPLKMAQVISIIIIIVATILIYRINSKVKTIVS
ncbi:prolipoprotein diacylglyceryl transferase [Clostridium uliginosum]|uniref:Phosphatidylglycerol--prolipoprotein diacylglyceryl transferase n=1 Tax=Clostridium uliginosum TaxID=119641 RepID=A0A1I1RJ37_9CLOT|nr:prolipoprotein diacylglyceryl transferase [Clostridium uliginosum]SFD34047.1 phosphatidylglycerol:prolipoprotein diacylglycerol transferase [Clostridium uliginosum]